jgi:general secretion pathway protein G
MNFSGYFRKSIRNLSGVTLVELVVTMAILSILAVLVIPSAQLAGKRTREVELKRNLRIIRTALDNYKIAYDKAVKPNAPPPAGLPTTGYPKDLKTLVEGVDFGDNPDKNQAKKKFLRRIPVDPFNISQKGDEPKWGIRAYKDEPDSRSNSDEAEDVYDVYSLSDGLAIDGTKYKDW